MPSIRSVLRIVETLLALAVLIVAVDLPGRLFGSVSIDLPVAWLPLEIVVFAGPAALAVTALAGTWLDGLSIGTTLVAVLSVLTLVMVVWSVATLLFATTGGVFFGWLFVLIAAVPLAVVVLVRTLLASNRVSDTGMVASKIG